MYLSSIKQNKGYISGDFTVDAPLVGTGVDAPAVSIKHTVLFTTRFSMNRLL